MEITTSRLRMSFIDEGNGITVVFLHPFPLSAEVFRADADLLSNAMRAIAPSMRGFGTTMPFDSSTEPSIDAMADDVVSLLDALGIRDRVVVLGISMGGYVALSLMRRYKTRLRGLVLVDTRADTDSMEARSARDRNIARLQAGEQSAVANELTARLLSKTTLDTKPEVAGQVHALAMQSSASAMASSLVAIRDRADSTDALASIRMPVLVVNGRDDALVPVATAEALAHAIPNAKLAILDDAGHLPNLETPKAFHKVVREFVRDLG
ncbi:MAG: alpha/beta hydrolase [Polyangiaceae bacterium]|nr:alpha/beta hydrolase [Polyangiaceae bacterium]